MKVIIDISDDLYNRIFAGEIALNTDDKWELEESARLSILHGKVLPKGHGRMIDADKTLEVAWQDFYKHEKEWEEKDKNYLPLHRFYDQNGFECCQQTIVNAPTIIEADKEAVNDSKRT